MWQTIRSIASLLLSYGLLLLANGLFSTLLGLRSKLEGFSTETVGLVLAGFNLGLLLGAIFAVRVLASVGHIRAFAAFASIMSVAVLGHLLRIDPVTWMALRVVAGFCMAGMVMVTESWINERSSNENRGQVLSLYMVTNYLGSGLGQFLLTAGDPAEFELFVIASIIFSLALVPILLTTATSPQAVSPTRMPFKKLFAVSPVGVIGTVAAAMCGSAFLTMGPVFATDQGFSVAQVSTFMACVILGGMALQFPIGRLSDRLDRRTVLILAALSAAGCALGIIWTVGAAGWAMFAFAALYGGFAYTLYPISAAQVNDRADPDLRVQVSAGLLIAFGTGSVAGPILASQLMGWLGPKSLFVFTISVLVLLILFAGLRMAMRRSDRSRKARFLPLGSLGASGKQLYTAVLKTLPWR